MSKKSNLFKTLPAIILSTLLVVIIIYAWTEPGSAPPAGNVPAPINVGDSAQIKSGPLQVNGFRNIGSTIFDGNVGIGTTSPGAKLDVNGAMIFRATSQPAVSSPDQVVMYYDPTTKDFKISINGQSYVNLMSGATVPAQITNLLVSGNGNQAPLSWSAPDNGGRSITGYRLYRGTTSGSENYFTTASTNSFTDTGLSAGITYYYKVSAVNSVGEGILSNEAVWNVPTQQILSSSGTWTKPAGVNSIAVTIFAGGGGGGGGGNSYFDGANMYSGGGGGGGGGGGVCTTIINVTSITSVSVIVGAGGTGGAGAPNDNNVNTAGTAGTSGGNSIFGTYCTATGGGGGTGGRPAWGGNGYGAGGGGSGGSVGGVGGLGGANINPVGAYGNGLGGNGGNAGGSGGTGGAGGGASWAGGCGGGGGGYSYGNNGGYAGACRGGNGSGGGVIVNLTY